MRTGKTRTQTKTNDCLHEIPMIIQYHGNTVIKSMREFSSGHIDPSKSPVHIANQMSIQSMRDKVILEKNLMHKKK